MVCLGFQVWIILRLKTCDGTTHTKAKPSGMLESIGSRWCILSVSFQLNGSVQLCQATLQHTSLGAICTCNGPWKHASKCKCFEYCIILSFISHYVWPHFGSHIFPPQHQEACVATFMTSRIWRSKRKAINGWTPFSQELRRDDVEGTANSWIPARVANGKMDGQRILEHLATAFACWSKKSSLAWLQSHS